MRSEDWKHQVGSRAVLKVLLVGSLALVMWVGLSACEPPPVGTPCTKAEDCATGQECPAGFCKDKPSCSEDSDCAATEVCKASTCTAKSARNCTDNAGCQARETCVNGNCETGQTLKANGVRCEAATECESGSCVEPPTLGFKLCSKECTKSLDCGSNSVCDIHSAGSPPFYCVPGCTLVSDCTKLDPALTVCYDEGSASHCWRGGVAGEECNLDEHCGTGLTCQSKKCAP